MDSLFLILLAVIYSLTMMVAMYGPPRKKRKKKRNNFHYDWSRK